MKKSVEVTVREAINASPLSMREAAKLAGMPYRSFIERAKKLGIYSPNQGGKGVPRCGDRNGSQIPLDEVLEGKHPQYDRGRLKTRLIHSGLKLNVCEECGISEWMGKPISIQLDHINGDGNDHRLENLKMVCPNCHSQTDTFAGKNKGRIDNDSTRSLVTDQAFIEALTGHVNIRQALISLGLEPKGANYKRADRLLSIMESMD